MAASVKSFGSGTLESFNSLVDHSGVIVLGSAAGAAVGFVVGGVPMAWLAAKITGLVLGMIYAMGRPTCVIQLNILSPQNSRAIGNVVASAGIPYFLIHALHLFVG
ncbi:MAG TPA: hypothetical protein VLF94_05525 [Chlamydiales bacterium]|nr:hypothetical protein [Chlamydiales bacterium]